MNTKMKEQLRWAWWRVKSYWPVTILFGLIAAGNLYGAAVNGHWSLWLVGLVSVLTPFAFFGVEYSRGGRAYWLYDILHVWGPKSTYVSPRTMKNGVHNPWWYGTVGRGGWQKFANKEGFSRKDLLGGAELRFIDDEPDLGWYRSDNEDAEFPIPDVDPDDPGIQSYGQSWSDVEPPHAVIYDEHATDMGTTGHEMDLLAFPKAFPEFSDEGEGRKITQLEHEGIR